MKNIFGAFVCVALAAALSGCGESKPTLDKATQAVEDAAAAVEKTAEEAVEAVEEAVE